MTQIISITGASIGIGADTARPLSPGREIYIYFNISEEPAQPSL